LRIPFSATAFAVALFALWLARECMFLLKPHWRLLYALHSVNAAVLFGLLAFNLLAAFSWVYRKLARKDTGLKSYDFRRQIGAGSTYPLEGR
jgi:hypothetical protein